MTILENEVFKKAKQFFTRRGYEIILFERANYVLNAFEVMVEKNDNMEIWRWDSSHGGGFWHQID